MAQSLALAALFLHSRPLHLVAADFDQTTHDGIAFVAIPAGQFQMGTSDASRGVLEEHNAWTRFNECEQPARRVTISKAFLISKCEITQKQWVDVMGRNPSAFKGEQLPVESVSWNEVQDFIAKMNARGHGRYRLPTEAEWEYCCRAGSTNWFGLGPNHETVTTNTLAECAWFRDNADNQTHEVGTKNPNAWGLCDLHGNVWEWCQDWYSPNFYASAPDTDPFNSAASTERVMRGGSWFLDWPNVRAATRSGNLPALKSQYVGFRLVREN